MITSSPTAAINDSSGLAGRMSEHWDTFVPEALSEDGESLRRARLHIRFGWLGAIFGTGYALFYLIIGHWIGAGIIIACSFVFSLVPLLLKRLGSLLVSGHLYAFILVVGFTGLCLVEGGISGHAIAWLSSIPLCVLLLLRVREAMVWTISCFGVALVFGALKMAGVECAKTYPLEWEGVLDTAGYAGLVAFMSLLGLTFERTRAKAFNKLEVAMEKLSVVNGRLQKLNEEKDEFMKIAAHDLKNPLCGISGYAEVLTMFGTPTAQQAAEISQTIQGLSQRMLNIITNLLDARRIEEGSMQLKPAPCAVKDLLNGIVNDHRRRAEHKRIMLFIEDSPPSAQVFADPGAMQQILDNLVSNAIKYSPSDTAVHCRWMELEHAVRLDIRDEGPGLSDSDQNNLFKKFSRLTPRPTGGEDSHGLGLWIVQKMAQEMGGEVICQSAIGHGATFSLILPKPVS